MIQLLQKQRFQIKLTKYKSAKYRQKVTSLFQANVVEDPKRKTCFTSSFLSFFFLKKNTPARVLPLTTFLLLIWHNHMKHVPNIEGKRRVLFNTKQNQTRVAYCRIKICVSISGHAKTVNIRPANIYKLVAWLASKLLIPSHPFKLLGNWELYGSFLLIILLVNVPACIVYLVHSSRNWTGP